MNEAGKLLQQARKKKRCSVEKAHKATKIKESYIIGLENSDLSAFPAELYYKNFLKTYAKYLGLDAQEILNLYETEKLNKQQDLFRQDDSSSSIAGVKTGNKHTKLIITVLVSAVMFIFLLILNSNIAVKDAKQTDEPPAVAVTAPTKAPEEQHAAEKPGKKTVLVKAVKDTWIRITADNKKIYEETLPAGAQYTASCSGKFVIKVGNIDGVDVYFNDNKVDILKGSGKNKVNTVTLG